MENENFMRNFVEDSQDVEYNPNMIKLATALLSFSHPASPVSAAMTNTLGLHKPATNSNPISASTSKSTSCSPADEGEIRAFAKLQGRDWTYYVQKVSVIVGRNGKPGSPIGENGCGTTDIDVHLGDQESISRKHLRIDYAGAHGWEMYCFGKTGVIVDGKYYDAFCQPIILNAKSLISVGGVEFYFLLPIGVPTGRIEEPSSQPNKKLKQQPILQHHSTSSSISEPVPDDVNATKPYLSYACLIAEAINTSPDQRLTLSDIYKYLMDKYPYFRHTKNGWQNSIRHNLSLNKAFMKIPRSGGEPGKGMFWVIDPNHRASLESKSYSRRVSGNAAIGNARGRAASAQISNFSQYQPKQTYPPGCTSVPASMSSIEEHLVLPVPIRAMSTISIPRAIFTQSPAHNMLLEAAEALEAEDSSEDLIEAGGGAHSAPDYQVPHSSTSQQQQQTFHPQPSRPFIFNGINNKF